MEIECIAPVGFDVFPSGFTASVCLGLKLARRDVKLDFAYSESVLVFLEFDEEDASLVMRRHGLALRMPVISWAL